MVRSATLDEGTKAAMRTPIHLDFRRERALRSAAIVLAASLACLGGAAFQF